MKNFILCLQFLCVTTIAFSQQNPDIIPAKPSDNWYFSASAGPSFIFSSDTHAIAFSNRLSPHVSLSAGKWILPQWGGFFTLQGGTLNNISTTSGYFYADTTQATVGVYDPVIDYVSINPDGTYLQKIRYMNLQCNISYSILDALSYQPERKFSLVPSVGIGSMFVFAYKGIPKQTVFSTQIGLQAGYQILPRLGVQAQVQNVFVPDNFEGRITKKQTESILSASLGISYSLRPKKFSTCAVPTENIEQFAQAYTDTVVQETVVRDTIRIQSVVQYDNFIFTAFLFSKNNIKPNDSQEVHYENIARFMKSNPSVTIRLDGYADETTGTEEFNLSISKARVSYIKSILVKKYGIEESRIIENALGAKNPPYSSDEHNRIVLVTIL